MTPFLDLRHIAIDPTLIRDLPSGLARYYEVLPIAREGDRVTVAMSHPENVTALAVLTRLFRAEIVPIQTDAAAVRATLQQVYARKPTEPHGLLAWLPAAIQPAWAELLAQMLAQKLAKSSGLATNERAIDGQATEAMPLTWLDADTIDAQTLLAAAHGGNYQLTLCALPEAPLQAALLRDIHAPLWLVPAGPILPRRILLVLRGFASDEVALRWVMRLVQHVEDPAVTLLPIMGQAPWGALNYLRQPGPAQGQITEWALRLAEIGIQPTLTLQSGDPRQQVNQAVRQGEYDLMVVAAEGHGQFVGQCLTDLNAKSILPLGGVLIVKPTPDHPA